MLKNKVIKWKTHRSVINQRVAKNQKQNQVIEKERIQYFTKRIKSGSPVHHEVKNNHIDYSEENQERVRKAKEDAFKEKLKIIRKHETLDKKNAERRKMIEDNQKVLLQIRMFKETIDLSKDN